VHFAAALRNTKGPIAVYRLTTVSISQMCGWVVSYSSFEL